jgi:hypothetical protein
LAPWAWVSKFDVADRRPTVVLLQLLGCDELMIKQEGGVGDDALVLHLVMENGKSVCFFFFF